jgi:hypothetical protein
MDSSAFLDNTQRLQLIETLHSRFSAHMSRHKNLTWNPIQERLEHSPDKLRSLHAMETTGGEPDIIAYDTDRDEYLFCDCSPESPSGRRSLCYDDTALDSRKDAKPAASALGMAAVMGIHILTEDLYRTLQELGPFDTKTSSWILTPTDIRERGGALFADHRYGHTFVYHNSAPSYYSSRGFRGLLRL